MSIIQYTLIPIQQECLDFISEAMAATGTAPSVDEIAIGLEISHQHANRLITGLDRAGCIRHARYGDKKICLVSDKPMGARGYE